MPWGYKMLPLKGQGAGQDWDIMWLGFWTEIPLWVGL